MSYNIAKYVTAWYFNGLHDGETMADISQTVFMWSNNEAFKWTKTHTHTHTYKHTHGHTPVNAIGENAMHCISLKISLPLDISLSWQKVVYLHS